ncbi:MAG TPA: S-layer homology domain-containing protein, partial [Sporosarcina psychrophila]|nr:S-layer homology domain-containing protein [Sporosarcina psychrophila]
MSSNQSAKYKKFIVGAASAALVASAVAPVASAKDFKDTKGNTHETAIDALSDAGVITGYPNGTFLPNKTLTRSDVVKLMGKWLVSEGYKVPTDYKTKMRFSDLTSKSNDELLQYAAVVKDNGVFNGSNGNLLAGDNITRENMAVVIVRAFDTVKDIELVKYVKEQDFKKDVTDLTKAKAEARTAIDVLDYFDITNPAAPAFNPKNTTTRGHFATFLHKSINTDFSEVKAPVVDVDKVAVDAAAEQVKAGAVTVARGNYATDAVKQEAVEAYVNSLITEKDVKATVTAGKTAGEYVVTLSKGEVKVDKTIAMTFDFAADDRFVTEVNALNATQVEVKFSTAVAKASVFNTDGTLKSNVVSLTSLDGVPAERNVILSSGKLSADGKTLTVTAATQLSKRYDVVVNGLKSVTGAAFDKYEKTITIAADKTAPTILGTERVSASEVKVTFSEPLKALGTVSYKLADGSTVAVGGNGITASEFKAGDTEVLLTIGSNVAANKEVIATFIGAQDQAGNLMTPNPATVSFQKGDLDGTKPTVSNITQLGDKKFELKFSEEIQNLSKEDVTIDGNATVSVTKDNTDSTKYIIEVTNSLEGAKIVKVQNFKDLSGEVGTPTGKAVTFVKDAAAPKVTSTNVVVDETDGKEYLELTFDKKVTATDATIQASNGSYVLNHVTTSGVNLVAKELKVKEGSNDKILRVALETLLGEHATKEGAVFTLPLTLTNVKSETGVAITTAQVEVKRGKDGSVANSDLVKVTEVAQNGTDTNSVVVTFNGEVDAESATNAANYTISGAKVKSATVKSTESNKVYLTLEANSNTFTGIRN